MHHVSRKAYLPTYGLFDERRFFAPGEALRYYMLTGHYRQPLEWTNEGLREQKNALDRLYQALQQANDAPPAADVPLPVMADYVRKHREPVGQDNVFKAFETMASDQIVASLNAWRDFRDSSTERLFMDIYGQPDRKSVV